MAIRNSFDTAACLDAIGSYDDRGSLDAADHIQWTMQLADFSDSFASEAFEPRLIASAFVDDGGTNRGVIELRALTKPVIVEFSEVQTNAATTAFFFKVDVGSVMTGTSVTVEKADIGGGTTRATLTVDSVVYSPFAGAATLRGAGGVWRSPPDMRVFIPQGSVGRWSALDAASTLHVNVIAREIPQLPYKRS